MPAWAVAILLAAVSGGLAMPVLDDTRRIDMKYRFTQGRPVAGKRFSAVVMHWSDPSFTGSVHSRNGLCRGAIIGPYGRFRRDLPPGRQQAAGSATIWSWKIPRNTAGRRFRVRCMGVTTTVITTPPPEGEMHVDRGVTAIGLRSHRMDWKIVAP